MNPQEQSLWNKIKDFPIDEEGVAFSFSKRLGRENGWTKAYALRVMEEYKKFLFLCCITENGITPSDPVDQAWHLHLTYTKSYWIDLCRNTLGKELHHYPTKGGKHEAKKFDGFYTHTHQLYKEKFGIEAPRDIWQDNERRFADINFQRINLKQYWLIRKPSLHLKKSFLLLGITATAFLCIQATLDASTYFFIGFIILFVVIIYRQKGKGGESSGCTTTGCTADSSHSNHHSDSGCNSGCSGCSGSGCSGCGGGGD